ncbi:MAG: M15 family metallopeptidase [Treponema sp.]|jgi:D-alanyl-D-alanine carboxypeptidase|nr:M15 family metallopeptidase [Treponema sp.]
MTPLQMKPPFPALPLFLLLCGCSACAGGSASAQTAPPPPAAHSGERLAEVLEAAGIPSGMVREIRENESAFLARLEKVTAGDRFLRILVDKEHPLPETYEPEDLVELRYRSYRAGITDVMMLREEAETALEAMAAAAKAAGITLTVSSADRSDEYQAGSFQRWTRRLGPAQAERVSARPGHSQHQTGLVVDFGSISNDFAETAAGRWVREHAGEYGWSLSFPRGYEALTGYDWESWHYRYVGRDLVDFIDRWFGGLQQHALRFIHEWENGA